MTANVKRTTMVVEEIKSSKKEFTAKNALTAKPKTSLSDKLFKKPSPCKTDARPLRDRESKILEDIPKSAEDVQNKIEKTATATDVKIKKQPDDLPKTSKNFRKKMSKICSGLEDVSLVERTAEQDQTNSMAKPRDSKTQKTRKSRIMYTKLYDLSEIPDKSNIRAGCTPRSSNVEEIHIIPGEKCVDEPQLINCHTVLNDEKIVKKSSVEQTIDSTKSKTFIYIYRDKIIGGA